MNGLHSLEPFVLWLLQTSWQASLLALFVLFLQRTFRNRLDARWIYALWGLVIIRLLAPSLPESSASVYHLTPVPSSPMGWIASSLPVVASTPFDAPLAPESAALSLLEILSIVWLTGALAVASISLFLHLRLSRRLKDSRLVQDPKINNLLKACAGELGLPLAPRTVIFPGISSPAVIGLWRPSLLLPENLSSRFSHEELRFIFLHELAHLKRGDLVVQWLLTLLQIFHWFNPVLWFAFSRIRQDREAATDAMVLAQTGETSRRDYGNTLLKLLEQFEHRNSLAGIVGILESKGPMQNRIRHISRFTRRAYRWSLLAAILLAVIAVFFLTSPRDHQATNSLETSSTKPKNFDSAFNEKITRLRLGPIKADDVLVSDFAKTLEKQFQESDPDPIPFAIKVQYLKDASPLRVTLAMDNPTVMEVIAELIEKYQIYDTLKTGECTLYVRRPEEMAFRKKALGILVQAKFDSTPVQAAFLSIQKQAAAQGFAFELKGLENLSPRSKITADLKNYPVERALRAVSYLGGFNLTGGSAEFPYTVDVTSTNTILIRMESRFIRVPAREASPDGLKKLEQGFLAAGFDSIQKIPGIELVSAPTVIFMNKSTSAIEVGNEALTLGAVASGTDLRVWAGLQRKEKNAPVEDFAEFASGNWNQKDGQSFLLVPPLEKEKDKSSPRFLVIVTLSAADARTGKPFLPGLPSCGIVNLNPPSKAVSRLANVPKNTSASIQQNPSKKTGSVNNQTVEIQACVVEVTTSNLSPAETKAFRDAVEDNDLNFLLSMKNADSMLSSKVAIRNDRSDSIIETTREMRFPTHYEKIQGQPMTPVKFETIPVGIRIKLNLKSQSEGILLSGNLEIRNFQGMTQGENNMGAAFDTRETRFNSLLQDSVPRIVNRFASAGKQTLEENGVKHEELVEKETLLILTAKKLAL